MLAKMGYARFPSLQPLAPSSKAANEDAHASASAAEAAATAAWAAAYGVDAALGRILAVLDTGDGGLVGYRKSVPTYHPQPYGHGCVIEIFNASDYSYIEMEVHGPVVTLQPGESFALKVD